MTDVEFNRSSLDQLLEQAKWGNPVDGELDALAAALDTGRISDSSNVYTAVHILGRSARPRHEALVAGYLDGGSGPMVARVALQALCSWFDVAFRYRADLIRFVRWEPWDEADDVRSMALSKSGEFLRSNLDIELFAVLLAVARDDAELKITRLGALRALGRALGEDWGQLPAATATRIDESWAREVIQRAETTQRINESLG